MDLYNPRAYGTYTGHDPHTAQKWDFCPSTTSMKRIRVDDEAAERLDALAEVFDGTKSGLASEALRRGVDALLDEAEQTLDDVTEDDAE